jgi:beta-lactam-binding protein with PASTA domain
MSENRKPSTIDRLKLLARNSYLWKWLSVVVVLTVVVTVLVNFVVMPAYTRHGVSVTVPDVLDDPYDAAAASLERAGLRPEEIQLRKPNLPRDVVIDQNPSPDARVKPGRRVYLTVNSGDTTTVLVPKVEGFSVREARNRINIQGLAVRDVLPDSIPSLHANTVTRQTPPDGTRVPPGAEVTLWYSTGLGDRQVRVPDVVGMAAEEAQDYLLSRRLRSVVIGEALPDREVADQSPAAGTSVREGFEIRLRLSTAADSTMGRNPIGDR